MRDETDPDFWAGHEFDPEVPEEERPTLDFFGELLLKGYTFDEGTRRLLAGAVADSLDVAGLGIEREVVEFLDLFETNPEARLIMTLAQTAGIPYSEARKRWSDPEDLAAELAWRGLEGAEHWAKCPGCGTDPADMVGKNGRPLAHGRWKFVGETCFVCSTLEKLNEGVEEKEKGLRYRVKPRGPRDDLMGN